MKSRTLADRLILKVLPEVEKKSAGGVIIPGISKEAPLVGEVVATGPNTFSKVGETVLFARNAGVYIDLDEGTFVTIRETPDNVYVIL